MKPHEMEEKIQSTYPGCDVVALDLTGEASHFEVRIAAMELNELSRIKQHQAIMAIFKDELATGEVHALSIKTLKK